MTDTLLDPAALYRELERKFQECDLARPFRRDRHEPGDELSFALTGVSPAHTGRAVLRVEKFVGGGFAGQVYRVRIEQLVADDGPIVGLQVGERYAIKILKPPSAFSCWFRDLLYLLAYQAPFAAQALPAAVRTGVLWQKIIRRASAARFGRPDAICDTFATFYDADLHSFGEINEWVTGRNWKFEVDDQLFDRWSFEGEPPSTAKSAEYIHKKLFMRGLVALLHEMGAPELARQYEWWTCKSQPNVLKRVSDDDAPGAGLTGIDFRAGLSLLPFAPMSPADIPLIVRGLVRGRLVQFDRSDPEQFRRFVEAHAEELGGLEGAIDELKRQEPEYRGSLPDVTHHHVRLLTSGPLRRSVRAGMAAAWRNLGRIDAAHEERLRDGPLLFLVVFSVWMVPLFGPWMLSLWGDPAYRRHLVRTLTSLGYLRRSLRGKQYETLIGWRRSGRVSDEGARRLAGRPSSFWAQRVLMGWLPASWHRAVVEPRWVLRGLAASVRFALDFVRKPDFRTKWLLEQVRLGREEGMLTPAEAEHIAAQVADPYIVKYLKCLAAHLCTLPVTQVVMLLVAVLVPFWLMRVHGWGAVEATTRGALLAGAIQLMPISPGSISRGIIVLFLMIKERDLKNYYIAAPISFVHVIGYLAFPFQMVARDPALARFMAGRWATQLVHHVPVFGERGALAEHFVFDLFFNMPLSLRRRFRERPFATTARLLFGVAVLVALVYVLYAYAWPLVHHAKPAGAA